MLLLSILQLWTLTLLVNMSSQFSCRDVHFKLTVHPTMTALSPAVIVCQLLSSLVIRCPALSEDESTRPVLKKKASNFVGDMGLQWTSVDASLTHRVAFGSRGLVRHRPMKL